MARPTTKTLRRDQGRPAQAARTLRRLAIAGLGDAGGVELDGPGEDGDGNVERLALEVFGVAGFASRPTGNAEALVGVVGQRGHRVVVAVRDPETARAAGADGLAAGEVMVYTAKTAIRITADGEVWISRTDGALERVATESHVHGGGTLSNGGGTVTGTTGTATANPIGGAGLSPTVKVEAKP
jgi:phage gp45-like